MSDPAQWTTPADITAKLRRVWLSGEPLRNMVAAAPFTPIEFPVRRPSAADVSNHFEAARKWAESLIKASHRGQHFTIITTSVGGRDIGKTSLPGRIVITAYEQLWRALGVGTQVKQFQDLCAQAHDDPAVLQWALQHPLAALRHASEWPALLAAVRWLDEHRGSGLYLRQIDAPGVDTKLIERNQKTLADILRVPYAKGTFAAALGYATKPATVRLRFGRGTLGMPWEISEAVLRHDELSSLLITVDQALIVENEITYLSVPVPPNGVVLWGKGFDVNQAASLPWLINAAVDYWGDIDTHGFAILNRVQTHLPQTRSILMDRETLLAHRERWGVEPSPTSAALDQLTPTDAALYADLVTGRYGQNLRLEQERIDWDWAMEHGRFKL